MSDLVGNPEDRFSRVAAQLIRHQDNMSVKCVPPQTPLLYCKTGVNRGMPIFFIFAPKHRLCARSALSSRAGSKRSVDYMACICLYFSGPEHRYLAPDADPVN